MDFLQLLGNKFKVFETFLQQENKNISFLETDKKYLTKINQTYYFCFRYKRRVYKYSLKTKDLITANKYKINIITRLRMNPYVDNLKELRFDIDYDINNLIQKEKIHRIRDKEPIQDVYKCAVSINASDSDDPEVIKRLENRILRILIEEKEKENIKSISINTNKIRERTIEEAFKSFYEYKSDEVSEASLKSYSTFYKYLLYFCDKDKKIANFDTSFFSDLFDNLPKMPKEVIRNKVNDNKNFDEIIKDYKDKEYEKLGNKYINRIFRFYKILFDFFEIKHYIKDGNIVKFTIRKETTDTKLPFKPFELQILKEKIEDPITKIFIQIGAYTGMRIKEIILLKHENIDLENQLINIKREETKTEAGKRIIPIHPKIFKLIKHFYYQSKEENDKFIFSKDGNVNAWTKSINKKINILFRSKNKSFHSLRKNFAEQLYYSQQEREIQVDDKTIKRLIGHSLNDITFEVYNLSKIEIEVLRRAIHSIDYEACM